MPSAAVSSDNAQFLNAHAATGRIGLAGGTHPIDRTIRKVQRGLARDAAGSAWSHAFLIGERRSDGNFWVLESDIDLRHKQIRLGVQENRIDKFFDATEWPNLALLDFSLDAAATQRVVCAALALLADSTQYSLREIVGTALALARPSLRARENLLAREGALYCSAFVQHCYAAAGVTLVPGLSGKNTTPHDIATTRVPHRAERLIRLPGATH